MIRRLLPAISVLSLLLCVSAVGVLVRSYRVEDEPTFVTSGHTFVQLTTRHGQFSLDVVKDWPDRCRAWYTGDPYDEFGPMYGLATNLYTQTERAGVTLISGSFFIAIRKGQAAIRSHAYQNNDVYFASDVIVNRRGFELRVPLGYCAALFAAIPFSWALLLRVSALRDRRRKNERRCVACGYDIRASKDRCPECGTPIPTE